LLSSQLLHPRDGVIYEIFPRDFSPEGNFNGIPVQLDRLKDLGVTILWLMPIHPIRQEKKKGTIGSPYAVRDYYAINPDYRSKDDLRRLISEAHKRRINFSNRPFNGSIEVATAQASPTSLRMLVRRCRPMLPCPNARRALAPTRCQLYFWMRGATASFVGDLSEQATAA